MTPPPEALQSSVHRKHTRAETAGLPTHTQRIKVVYFVNKV
jgi:hypothetical protein